MRGLGRFDWLNIVMSQIVQVFTDGVLHSSLYGDVMRHATGEKMDSASFTKLNLSAEQKTKMDALVQKCNKDGCTKESMDAFMKSAEGVLSKEQLATLKAECAKMHEKKDAKA